MPEAVGVPGARGVALPVGEPLAIIARKSPDLRHAVAYDRVLESFRSALPDIQTLAQPKT